jgi:DNA-binding NtrC family response regulator
LTQSDAPCSPGEDSPWTKIDLSGSLADASRRVVAEVEQRKIVQALKEASGNPGLAAEILQIGFRTLQVKLKEYEIS